MITDPKQAGKYIFGVVRLSDKGQIVIPKEAREVFGLKPGDSMLLFGDINQGLAPLQDRGVPAVCGTHLPEQGDGGAGKRRQNRREQ